MRLSCKEIVVLFAVTPWAPSTLGAQDCAHGPAQMEPVEVEVVYAWPEQDARSAVEKAVRKAGFKLQREESSDSIIVTQTHTRWGDTPDRRHFSEHRHPGVDVLVRVVPLGDSSRVTFSFRTLCAVPRAEPPHDHGSPEEVAQILASMDLGMALTEEYQSWLRSHPEAARPSDDSMVMPRLLRCPRPTWIESTVESGVSGQVIVQGVVDTTGFFENRRVVVMSSDHPDLEPYAVELAAGCRFEPATHAGQRVKALVRFPINVHR